LNVEVWYRGALAVWLALAAVTFAALFRRAAPYGRHTTAGAGRVLAARWGWLLMETPAVVGMLAFYLVGRHRGTAVATIFLLLWLAHYLDRAWVYPFRLPREARPMPAQVVVLAFAFQSVNAWLHGVWLFSLGEARQTSWLTEPRFAAGATLFFAGLLVNRLSDRELRRLRDSTGGYSVPTGGLHRWVSCPNYLGEIVMWSGWALATWCPPALAFALWTIANLAPRAWSHHRWYQERFADYPRRRRALVPFVW